MQHFFVEPSQIQGNRIRITGTDVNHIRNVLRMHSGEEISVSNGTDGRDYRCEIDTITEDEVLCRLMFIKEDGVELPVRITLFQGLPKADKMELIIQKAVELGAAEIVPVATARCVVKLDDKKAKSKVERWQGISEAAAKQSKRAVVPQVCAPMSMKEALNYASEMAMAAIPYELAEGMQATDRFVEDVCKLAAQNAGEEKPQIGIFIGPEGGFTEEEITFAQEKKVCPLSLGKRILRTETAGMAILSVLMYHLEERG
ncbi:MAG: 16S rRNA (uracil(1498)-N(3))-methyltransferase [Lachnospiraceae bacterium]|nr:16S rRNA (uracil(1498)-N(3))-methyltransferase [Lachnospiraceae bacterium]MBR3736241.1 16S rRNA (uracil(1498)-N(3))-methyltransferase [Lachnospiraceae bacterium]